jgi:glucoamylase
VPAQYAFWWEHAAIASVPAGAGLAVALTEPAIVHWGRDGWLAVADVPTSDSGLGFHVAVLDTAALAAGSWIDFTWRRQDTGEWCGRNCRVEVTAAQEPVASFTRLQPGSRAAK